MIGQNLLMKLSFSNDSEEIVDTFMFSNYGKNSLFKDFQLSVNLSSEMNARWMYHSNKKLDLNQMKQQTNQKIKVQDTWFTTE